MAPRTVGGRIFCMLFAMIGIPLTVTVIADLGAMFANSVSSLYERIKRHLPGCRAGEGTGETSGFQLSERMERALTVIVSVIFLVLYIAIGGGLFLLWESWSFLESFYFCFITMTTIGFGDFVPGENRENEMGKLASSNGAVFQSKHYWIHRPHLLYHAF